MPSAGRPLSWQLLDRLLRAGVEIARITHAAGLSSTGSAELDRRLPLPERSEVPAPTVEAIAATQSRGGRVIAAGTTVVRALESRAAHGVLTPGRDEATLLIGPGFTPRVCEALLTGMHPPGTPHFAVLEAFAPRALLERALAHAERAGYLEHEFGDSCIVLPNAL
jgi:S-adenosylmethionine:tRNA ribosyltransferase-isomerase